VEFVAVLGDFLDEFLKLLDHLRVQAGKLLGGALQGVPNRCKRAVIDAIA
jgi:hypothetical protein